MKPHPLQQLGPIARRGLIGCLLVFAILAAEPGLFAQQGNQSGKAGKAPPGRRFSKEPPGGPAMGKPKEFFRKIQAGRIQPGKLYVKFRDGTTPQQKQAAHAAARMSRVEDSFEDLLPNTVRVAIPPGREQESVNAYLDDPNVIYAEPVYLRQLQSTVPNDPDWPVLWGMHRINVHHAWDVATGDPNFTIGIVDSGLYASHLDLGGNVWVNPGEVPGNGIDDDQNGKVDDINGWHFGWNWDDMVDIGGSHGTHVAGTIGAMGNNSRRGVGVNWNCKILMAGCGVPGSQGDLGDTIAPFRYILTNNVRLSNHSYRGTNWFETEYLLFLAARNMGHIAVCAAGNDAFDNDTSTMRAFPASYLLDNIISVAASSLLDDLAIFSNYGATNVDLAAPGFSILSTVGVAPDGTAYKEGTSMASPHVAGAIGLIWSTRTNLAWWQIRERILTGVKPVLGLATTVHSGGRLDVARSMAVFCEKGAGTGAGFLSDPYRDFDQALDQVPSYGQLYVRSSYSWTGRIGDNPMRIAAHGGPVRIGQ